MDDVRGLVSAGQKQYSKSFGAFVCVYIVVECVEEVKFRHLNCEPAFPSWPVFGEAREVRRGNA